MQKKTDPPQLKRMVEDILGCKWSLGILEMVRDGINRPGIMTRQFNGLTTKVLSERLSKLIRYGVLVKTVYPESPPRVEYSYTNFGLRFLKIVDAINELQEELDGSS